MIDLDFKIREINAYSSNLAKLEEALKPQDKETRIADLHKLTMEEDFWSHPNQAKSTQQEISRLQNTLENLKKLKADYEDLLVLLDLIQEEADPQLIAEIKPREKAWLNQLEALEMETYFSDELDTKNALLTLHSGAGGTEACDWVAMLFRMYQRWADRRGMQVKVYDSVDGDEAGFKSISFLVEGNYAYGMLRHEMGVHRLVRMSPFDSSGRRHTSFASLEVLPQLDEDIEVDINEEDLRIDYYRASGAGGQHVNKTSSAVRITHLPTNIVVSCQNERSQLHNREAAMQMLKSKLYTLAKSKHLEKIEDLKGDQKDIAWGSQIRSYVFAPYTLVKDNRTDVQTADIDEVMDGEIQPFIMAMLTQQAAGLAD